MPYDGVLDSNGFKPSISRPPEGAEPPGGAGGLPRPLARLAFIWGPGLRAEPGPLQRVFDDNYHAVCDYLIDSINWLISLWSHEAIGPANMSITLSDFPGNTELNTILVGGS